MKNKTIDTIRKILGENDSNDLKKIIISVALFIIGIILTIVTKTAKFPLGLIYFLPAYIFAGYDTFKECFEKIKDRDFFNEDFLMTVATLGALIIGEYPEAAAVMVLYRIGEYLEERAVEKTRGEISSLSRIIPNTARLLQNGVEIITSPEQVNKGATISIHPGDRIPLDCVVIEGESEIDTSSMTGENIPVSVSSGSRLISGTVNKTGTLYAKTECVYTDSVIARVQRLTEESAERKSKSEKFITSFSKIYTPAVLIAALILAVIPSIVTGNVAIWIHRALTFLVVSCPCALVISVPLAFFGGLGAASKSGILIKGSGYIEALSAVKTVVFDKTGTLTKGNLYVSGIYPIDIPKESLIKIAAFAEAHSSHPIARALRDSYGEKIILGQIKNIKEHAGFGVEALIAGKRVIVGNAKMLKEAGIIFDENKDGSAGTVYVAAGNKYLGYITVSDSIKEGAADAIKSIYDCGVTKTVMLTGDSKQAAGSTARKLGINAYRASLLPDKKLYEIEMIIRRSNKGEKVAMVGDGINDAPVLKRADVGIAMGAIGSDAAVEAADVIIADDDLRKIPRAIKIAKRTLTIAKQNIIAALAIKFIVLLLCAFGIGNMWLAVFADVGVSLLSVLNSMRTTKL